MKPIGRNSFWLLFARLTAQALAVFFTAIIARKLGVDDFGQFSFIASLILIGNTFTNFGTDTFLVREIARTGCVREIAAQSLALLSMPVRLASSPNRHASRPSGGNSTTS